MAIELTADQLRALSAKLRAVTPRREHSERRRAPRLDLRATVSVALVDDGESGPIVSMRIRDLSHRGVCLVHSEPLQHGKQFVLSLQRGDGAPVQILCTVMNCRATKNFFTIGAEFTCALSPLPEAIAPMNSEVERIKQLMLD
jgi:hypothetical protein